MGHNSEKKKKQMDIKSGITNIDKEKEKKSLQITGHDGEIFENELRMKKQSKLHYIKRRH